ncbi:tRNA (adenosine(37)-N6)-threonylcarbamoyltransferase complex transferase subunit TsaD [Candidatus Nomurabacteria bacterium RIFCSPLOWO2_01_FULL_33_24]|uniref:tRNA N6-adenosine threonylcarbamoyltransferase n=1 Tax=Candidatus Nomurabacteria bacterium RIFCSPLOWO2_01_FULL_33_24 TaxID=1801765 RepID=A0A1F6X2W1_9BACT|nr:MAG: tRNA (adenosine(37)-N6)-threonylcarbamoyltransferase complex transferase subunit TsaD [Candidatus Nomurabacteria bacterium RIFCSPLOWO2_01_FULL_33_24]
MIILSIETSCDETAISIVKAKGSSIDKLSFAILANKVSSQIDIHQKYGGVYPMLAKREHLKNLPIILKEVFKETNYSEDNPPIDLIAITYGPGLEPALWTGINFAKKLSEKWNKPLSPINHMEGHIFSALVNQNKEKFLISNFQFPIMALLISGGHTELVLMKNWFKYKIIGQTRDDAVGEAFDKVARLLGLPYPGGPEISKLAEKGKENSEIKLPRPMINSNDYDFSFAGLKTAVLYKVKKIPRLTNKTKIEIAKEFQEAVIDVLIRKTIRAVKEYKIKTVILGGGVSANKQIQEAFKKTCQKNNIQLFFPTIEMTTDNALMIAIAGYLRSIKNKTLNIKDLSAEGNLRLS